MSPRKQKITPCLWFAGNAEEAARYYVSLFKDSRILDINYYSENSGMPEGSVMALSFELAGQMFMALNGPPLFKFSEAISMCIDCEDQAEIDRLWDQLIADGGTEAQCGWLKDKFGLSWQIVNFEQFGRIHKNPQHAARAWQAIMKMKKIDLAAIEAAVSGASA